jgi:hypothetical protein
MKWAILKQRVIDSMTIETAKVDEQKQKKVVIIKMHLVQKRQT